MGIVNVQSPTYQIKVESRPIVVKVQEAGLVVKVAEDSFRQLPSVIVAKDKPLVVNAETKSLSLVVKNTVHVLKTTQHPIIAKVENPAARIIAVNKRGLPGPPGVPADTQVIDDTLTANGTSAVDSVSVNEAQALDWWVSAEDATGARRSYFITAIINSADVIYRKFGNIGAPVSFTSRVEIQGSDVALVVENLSADPLIIRTIRLQKRFN